MRHLTRLSFAELMDLKVTSVTKSEQPMSQAAAAVTVLSQEDLRRSGAVNLPEALRMVPGLIVTRVDAHRWAITSRGNTYRFANKLLVLIDGRSVYDPLFGGVFWDQQDTPLEEIERVEVIRGPGAALWGSNAVEGVINVITKHTSDTLGGLAVVGGGTEEHRSGMVRHGGKLGDRATYRVWTSGRDRDSSFQSPSRDSHDAWSARRGGFRIDWDRSERQTLCLQGDLFDQEAQYRQTIASRVNPPTETFDEGTRSSGGYLRLEWKETESRDSDQTLKLYLDRREQFEEFEFKENVFDLDYQKRQRLSRMNQLTWGAGYRHLDTRAGNRFFRGLTRPAVSDELFSAFVQDRLSWRQDRLELTLGARVEHNDFTGFEFQPTARLRWSPDPSRTWWVAISDAVTTPVRNRLFLYADQAVIPGAPPTVVTVFGDPGVKAEKMRAYELGYREQCSPEFSYDVALFSSRIDDAAGNHFATPYLEGGFRIRPIILDNSAREQMWGGEVSATWNPTQDWRLTAGVTYLNLDVESGLTITNHASPSRQFNLRSYWNLSEKVQLDTMLYRVEEMPDLKLPAYVRADVRLGYQATKDLDVSLIGQNLFDSRHAEFVDTRLGRPAREVEQSFYLQARQRF